MREKSKSPAEQTAGAGGPSRGSEHSPWSRSRRRAAAYAASIDHLQGLMALRTR